MTKKITTTIGISKKGCIRFLIYPILFPTVPVLYIMLKYF